MILRSQWLVDCADDRSRDAELDQDSDNPKAYNRPAQWFSGKSKNVGRGGKHSHDDAVAESGSGAIDPDLADIKTGKGEG